MEWLAEWIDKLEGAEVNAIVEGAAKNRNQKGMNDDASDNGDEQGPASSGATSDRRGGTRKVRMASTDSDEGGGAGSLGTSRRLAQHHEQPVVKDLLGNFPMAKEQRLKYRKCAARKCKGHLDASKCQENSLCTYERMSALGDSIAALPQPLPAGA